MSSNLTHRKRGGGVQPCNMVLPIWPAQVFTRLIRKCFESQFFVDPLKLPQNFKNNVKNIFNVKNCHNFFLKPFYCSDRNLWNIFLCNDDLINSFWIFLTFRLQWILTICDQPDEILLTAGKKYLTLRFMTT